MRDSRNLLKFYIVEDDPGRSVSGWNPGVKIEYIFHKVVGEKPKYTYNNCTTIIGITKR